MRPSALFPALALTASTLALPAPAAAQRLLWSSAPGAGALPADPTPAPLSLELADDFEAWGEIAGLSVAGAACPHCEPSPLAAVEVRFWSGRAPGGPGALEAEFRFAAGDDHLKVDLARPDHLGLRFATPFAARGRHFVSVRLEFQGAGAWSWLRGSEAYRLEPAWVRGESGTWAPAADLAGIESDLAFELASSPWDEVDLARGCGRLELEAPPAPKEVSSWRLIDVAALDGERAFAIGSGKTPDGSRALAFERRQGVWRLLEAPLPAGAQLEAVEALPSGEIWFVGSHVAPGPGPLPEKRQPLILVHDPGPATWKPLPIAGLPGAQAELFDLTSGPGGTVWLVGSYLEAAGDAERRAPLLLHWDGAAFKRHELPPAPGGASEALVAVASDGEAVWAVGGGRSGALAGNPLVAYWKGGAWQRVAVWGLDGGGELESVAVRGAEVWIGGSDLGAAPLLLGYDGRDWSFHDSAIGGRALAAPKGADWVTAGAGLASFRAGGWRAEPGRLAIELTGLSAVAECSLYAVGAQPALGAERGVVLRLVREGFADGFESSGFAAWSAVGAERPIR